MPADKIKFFDPEKGYGFIVSDDDGGAIFLDQSALQREGISHLLNVQRVSFEQPPNSRTGLPHAARIEFVP